MVLSYSVPFSKTWRALGRGGCGVHIGFGLTVCVAVLDYI